VSPAQIVVAPMVTALVAAVLTTVTRRWPRLQRGLSLVGGVAYLAFVAMLGQTVLETGTATYQVSMWRPPFGIVLVADALAVFMLAIAAVVGLATLVYSVLSLGEFSQRVSYHPLFHFMLVGVSGAFLTGDIFNLFVWFEVMLMPSYVLVTFYSGPEHTRAGIQYTVLNLVGSAVMLVSIGGLYATTGTLNMADIARRLTDPAAPAIDPLPVLGLSAILLAVFMLKAGVVPFQFWVPAAYRAAPPPVTAFLAGVTKKVGVYAVVRLCFTVLGGATLASPIELPGFAGSSFLAFFGPLLFLMAAGSILLGGVGAVSRADVDGVLAYSSIGQVGFIVLPLAVAATASGPVRTLGVLAALVYALNHALAKSALFLLSGAIEERTGTGQLDELGGLAGGAPVLAGSFFVGALGLVGIPPLVGFFGKLFVFQTAVEAGVAGATAAWLALAVALAGAILTIAYLSRVWNLVFWGEAESVIAGPTRTRWGMAAVCLALAAGIVVVGVGFEPVYRTARAAATAALDSGGYVDAVDPGVVG